MRVYVLTDELQEEVINVFLAKNDNAAKKIIKRDLQNNARQVEVKLYALDIDVDYDEKLIAFYDDGDDKETRLLMSFPETEIVNENELKKDINKDSEEIY